MAIYRGLIEKIFFILSLLFFLNVNASEFIQNYNEELPRKNVIINGSMNIWQRGTIFAIPAGSNAYTADRWNYGQNVTPAEVTISRDTDIPTAAELERGVNYSLKIDCTTADTNIAAGDVVKIEYLPEGYDFKRFVGKVATLSFWVKSNKTGVYGVSFKNSGSDRSYVETITINSANTWEKKTVTLTFNYSGGTWNYTNGKGLTISIVLMCGANRHTTSGSWQNGNYDTTSDQVNFMDSTKNVFWLTGVQLELGSEATEFEYRTISEELSLCERYYEIQTVQTENGVKWVSFRTQKRTAPIVTVNAGYSGNITVDGFELIHNASVSSTVVAECERY